MSASNSVLLQEHEVKKLREKDFLAKLQTRSDQKDLEDQRKKWEDERKALVEKVQLERELKEKEQRQALLAITKKKEEMKKIFSRLGGMVHALMDLTDPIQIGLPDFLETGKVHKSDFIDLRGRPVTYEATLPDKVVARLTAEVELMSANFDRADKAADSTVLTIIPGTSQLLGELCLKVGEVAVVHTPDHTWHFICLKSEKDVKSFNKLIREVQELLKSV